MRIEATERHPPILLYHKRLYRYQNFRPGSITKISARSQSPRFLRHHTEPCRNGIEIVGEIFDHGELVYRVVLRGTERAATSSADKMKVPGNGKFELNYTDGGDGYCRELHRLYVMKSGARERLRMTPSGQVTDVDAIYVFEVTRSSRNRMNGAALRNLVKRVVREAEEAQGGVTLKGLEEAHVLGTDFFRHAFGTFMVRNRRLEVAAVYLHHAKLDMLREVYSATPPAVSPGGLGTGPEAPTPCGRPRTRSPEASHITAV